MVTDSGGEKGRAKADFFGFGELFEGTAIANKNFF